MADEERKPEQPIVAPETIQTVPLNLEAVEPLVTPVRPEVVDLNRPGVKKESKVKKTARVVMEKLATFGS